MTNDSNILSALKAGDNNKALKLLYASALPKVQKYVKSNNGDRDDANDIFQDAVIILIRQIRTGKFDESKSAEGFVFTISRNIWINKAIRNKKRVLVDEIPEKGDFNDEIQTNIELKEREGAIKSLLNNLGEKCSNILKQIVFEGKDYKEIAISTGLASGDVVKTYKNRCKKKLIGLLQANHDLRNELLRHEQGFRKYITSD